MPGPPTPGVIGAVRGVFAAFCFIPMILKESKLQTQTQAANPGAALEKTTSATSAKKFWAAAAELALWNLVAQGACNVALLFTDATRVSFLTQASIAFTPVLVSVSGDKVGRITWAGCALAIAGVVLLGFDGGGDIAGAASSVGLNIGDFIALGLASQAVCTALGGATTLWANILIAKYWLKEDLTRWYVLSLSARAAAARRRQALLDLTHSSTLPPRPRPPPTVGTLRASS